MGATGRLILVVGFLAGLVVAVDRCRREPPGHYVPGAYIEQADSLIRHRRLVFVPAGGQLPAGDTARQDTIFPVFGENDPEYYFYVRSNLANDVYRFNVDPSAARLPFRIENSELLGVDTFFHTLALPFSREHRWAGVARVRTEGAFTTLYDAAGFEINVREPTSPEARRTWNTEVHLDGVPRSVSTVAAHLRAGQENLATFSYQGDSATVESASDLQSADTVLLNGVPVASGHALRLEDGDWLRFSWANGRRRGERTLTADGGRRRTTATFARRRGDAGQMVERLYPIENLRPLTEPLADAMDAALGRLGARANELDDLVIELALDRTLSDALANSLSAWCRANPTPRRNRPRAVAVTVMDAFTGEVRAMPSCPDPAMLRQWPTLSDRERVRLLRNQNLLRHPVGSVTKPFWLAAIASTYPNLLDLELSLPSGDTVGTLLGCTIAPYSDDHAHPTWMGMEEFIERSCNGYMATLSVLPFFLADAARRTNARCDRPLADVAQFAECFPRAAGPTPLRLCGTHYISAVLGEDIPGFGDSCNAMGDVLNAFAPARRMADLTGVPVRSYLATVDPGDASPLESWRASRFRIDAWDPVVGMLTRGTNRGDSLTVHLSFVPVAPEQANLALNTVDDLRDDWIAMVLGGATGLWSNVSLAEAMARLLTGRDVHTRFATAATLGTERDSAVLRSELLPAASLHPGVRRRTLHAMELAATRGTAARIQPHVMRIAQALSAGTPGSVEAYAFAKTGSATVEKLRPGWEARVLAQLLQNDSLAWDPRGRRVVRTSAARARIASFPLGFQRIVLEALDSVEAAPAAHTVRRGATPSTLFYLDEQQRLRALPALTREVREGAALVVGLLLVPREMGRAMSRTHRDWITACAGAGTLEQEVLSIPPADQLVPERAVALSIVIWIDDEQPVENAGASRIAVDLFGHIAPILQEFAAREWSKRDARSN